MTTNLKRSFTPKKVLRYRPAQIKGNNITLDKFSLDVEDTNEFNQDVPKIPDSSEFDSSNKRGEDHQRVIAE